MTGWQMTLPYQKTNGNWADATDANLVTGTITNPQGSKATWDNLKLGTYKVVEETKAGWYSPVVTSDPYTITGPTVSHNFTFTNTPFG